MATKKQSNKTDRRQQKQKPKKKENTRKERGTVAAPPVHIPALPTRLAKPIDYSTLHPLTPTRALAVVVGAQKLLHSRATRKVWAYVKRKRLLDPQSNKIKADAVLRRIFPKAEVSRLEMTQAVRANLN